jgi:hypothetical protein
MTVIHFEQKERNDMRALTPATMIRINHLRDKLRDVEQRLREAYLSDLPIGTLVEYEQKSAIVVEISRHNGPHRCWVRNPQTKREYLLDYARILRVVDPEHAQQRPADSPEQLDTPLHTLSAVESAQYARERAEALSAAESRFETARRNILTRAQQRLDERLPFDDTVDASHRELNYE